MIMDVAGRLRGIFLELHSVQPSYPSAVRLLQHLELKILCFCQHKINALTSAGLVICEAQGDD